MKRKINVQLLGIATAAILLTSLLVGGIFYELFQKQVNILTHPDKAGRFLFSSGV